MASRERYPSSDKFGRSDYNKLVKLINEFFVSRVFPNKEFSKQFNEYFFPQLKIEEPKFTDDVVVRLHFNCKLLILKFNLTLGWL